MIDIITILTLVKIYNTSDKILIIFIYLMCSITYITYIIINYIDNIITNNIIVLLYFTMIFNYFYLSDGVVSYILVLMKKYSYSKLFILLSYLF
jgi:hypothetical protein